MNDETTANQKSSPEASLPTQDETDPSTDNAPHQQNQETLQMFKQGIMNKVQSKKRTKDDLAQNSQVLRDFKEEAMKKLSPEKE